MYQKCPNCNGLGSEQSYGTTFTSTICSVCKGTKIIDTVTGLPPSQYNELTPKSFSEHMNNIGDKFNNDIEK